MTERLNRLWCWLFGHIYTLGVNEEGRLDIVCFRCRHTSNFTKRLFQ